MDRNGPPALVDAARNWYDESKALIAKWHGRGRCLYAITPRFAATSSPEQLEMAGSLWREHPDVFVQTHIAENKAEIAWVKELFPERRDYLDVYAHYGLTGRRAVLAHGVHFSESEFARCHENGTALAHCPTSNNFLGSGLFAMRRRAIRAGRSRVGLGTDIGGGRAFRCWRPWARPTRWRSFWGGRSTRWRRSISRRSAARALALDDKIGTLAPGREADLVVLDPNATPLLAFRNARSRSIAETLGVLTTLGDDRVVRATYVAGKLAHADMPRFERAGGPFACRVGADCNPPARRALPCATFPWLP